MIKKHFFLKLNCGLLFLALANDTTNAAPVPYSPDYEVADRSDFIVVGHLKDNKLQLVQHQESSGYKSWEHNTTLVITQVLKGSFGTGECPIVIHYGLQPVILKDHPSFIDNLNPPSADDNHDPNASIGLNWVLTDDIGGPTSMDIRQDQIWFLRFTTPYHGAQSTDRPGIWFPQDVQPLSLKMYFTAILSGDPAALTEFTARDSPLRERAQENQSHLRINQIARIPDASQRCDQLLPIFLTEKPHTFTSQFAFDQIIACGSIGAAKLAPIYQNPKYSDLNEMILSGWEQDKYVDGLPFIVDWLRKEDQWWANQNMKDGIQAVAESWRGGRPYNDPHAISYRNIRHTIMVLSSLHGAEGKAVVEQIEKRWKAVDPNNELVKVCDDALASFEPTSQ